MDRLKTQSRRRSTRKNYHGIWKSFNQFYLKLDERPDSWEERLTLFVGYLIHKEVKSNTIKCYISAIKAVLQYEGIKLNEDKVLLSTLTRACRITNDVVNAKLPIRRGLVSLLINSLPDYYSENPQPYLITLFSAMISTAYFGLFRIGEITDSDHVVKAKNVFIGTNKQKLMFILHSSKTHGKESKPQIIKISASDRDNKQTMVPHPQSLAFCPFTLLENYLQARKPRKSDSEPFFVFQDRTPVSPANFRNILDELLKHNHFDARLYSSQGFRAGRTTDLYELGVSVETIKKLGRWSSSAVNTYLRT